MVRGLRAWVCACGEPTFLSIPDLGKYQMSSPPKTSLVSKPSLNWILLQTCRGVSVHLACILERQTTGHENFLVILFF